jgi:hypothetical protein
MSLIKKNCDLTGEDVIIGECKGLSAVFEVSTSSAMSGLLMVETEHGPLYLDPDQYSKVVGPNGILEPEIVGPNGLLVLESEG